MAKRGIGVAVVGTGWIGEIRAKVCVAHPEAAAPGRPVLVTLELPLGS